jgi:hypothetical protein
MPHTEITWMDILIVLSFTAALLVYVLLIIGGLATFLWWAVS